MSITAQQEAAHPGDEYEDMSLDSGSSESTGPAELPTISLSFGNGAGGAWDDRELVNAYDAAMEEFHVHHPGPGSWLDKATAALAKGQPLPGASDHGTAWYSASYTGNSTQLAAAEVALASEAQEPPSKKARTSKTNGAGGGKKNSNQKSNTKQSDPTNPYTPTAGPSRIAPSQDHRQNSPSYAPPSPPARVTFNITHEEEEEEEEEEEDPEEDEEVYDESFNLSQTTQQQHQHHISHPQTPTPGPSYGTHDAQHTSANEAYGYAMTAQYWAGYWMGIAQAKSSPPTPQPVEQPSERPSTTASRPPVGSALKRPLSTEDRRPARQSEGSQAQAPSNVMITKQHFNRDRPLRR